MSIRKKEETRIIESVPDNVHVKFPSDISIDLENLLGHEECKKDLQNIIEYLKDPQKYELYNVLPYSKYLLCGQDGVGKVTLACAVAKSAGIPIFIIEPAFFLESKENLTENINALFDEVCRLYFDDKHCILLFKEIVYLSNSDTKILHTALKSILEYFENIPNLIAFATLSTSVNCEISKLLIDPPAFSKIITLRPPQIKVREKIFKEMLQKIPCEKSLDIHRLALDSYEMSTGEIKQLIRDATLIALQNNKKEVAYTDFSLALAQNNFGYADEKLNAEERLATARHEAGHVIAGYFASPKNYKVSKIEITPRSQYLGITQTTVNEEKKSYFAKDYEANILGILGGMASEYYYYNSTTSGVDSDLEQATEIAIYMFKKFGMNKDIGPINLLSETCDFAELNKMADIYIHKFLMEMYNKALKIIEKHKEALNELTQALIDNEILYSNQVMEILKKY